MRPLKKEFHCFAAFSAWRSQQANELIERCAVRDITHGIDSRVEVKIFSNRIDRLTWCATQPDKPYAKQWRELKLNNKVQP